MVLVIALNVIAAIVIVGGLSLAMLALYRGLGDRPAQPKANQARQPRMEPGTARRHEARPVSGHAAPVSGRTAWTAR